MNPRAKELMTMQEARITLGYSSRNSIEHLVKTGKIRYVWISPKCGSKIRLILRKDVEALQ